MYYKPFVDWIWGGCVLMALGGLLAASDRRYRVTQRERAQAETLAAGGPGDEGSLRFMIPLALFLALVAFLAAGLKLDPRAVPSPLIGKPAPGFELPRLDDARHHDPARRRCWARRGCSTSGLRGADPAATSIRTSSRSPRPGRPRVGLNYKDKRDDARAWLKQLGDPYELSLSDLDGRVGIDFGVYGVPETFVIDKQGVIRFKHIGPMTPEVLQTRVVPLLKELNG